jgi:hypothetical protein
MQDEDNVAILITTQGSIQLTGADIGIGALMDAREHLLEYIRSQVIRPQVPQQAVESPEGEEAEG